MLVLVQSFPLGAPRLYHSCQEGRVKAREDFRLSSSAVAPGWYKEAAMLPPNPLRAPRASVALLLVPCLTFCKTEMVKLEFLFRLLKTFS